MNQWTPYENCRTITFAVIVLSAILSFTTPQNHAEAENIPIRSESNLPKVLTGEPFRHALKTPIPGVTWNGTPLRRVIREFAETSKISIIRDRRIDPTKTVTLSLNNQTRREILAAIAQSVDAEMRIVGHVVYLGPPEAAGPIRTLAAIRAEESSPVHKNQRPSARDRLPRRTIRWADLSEPRKIVERIADEFGLNLANPDEIPHDLWEGATLSEMTAAEMLTVVLIQFDLTFATDEPGVIRLIPLPDSPEKIALVRSYTVPPAKREALEAWKKSTKDVTIQQSGSRVTLRARLEKHEDLARLLSGNPTEDNADPKPTVAPLERRRFTLTVTGVPARAIMNQLEASGITFEYDAAALKQAEIDFATPVTMDLQAASPETFLAAIFDPLGLDFEFSGTNVRLSLKD